MEYLAMEAHPTLFILLFQWGVNAGQYLRQLPKMSDPRVISPPENYEPQIPEFMGRLEIQFEIARLIELHFLNVFSLRIM